MKNSVIRSVLCVALGWLPLAGLAWGPDGHQAVGAIADQLLQGTAAWAAVQQTLGGLTLQTASVWADCAKGVSSPDDVHFTYHPNNHAYPECLPYDTPAWHARMEAFVSRNWKQCGHAHGNENCHNQYHYADVSNLQDHYQDNFIGARPDDVVHAVNAAIAVLRNQQPDSPFSIADKQEALLLLSHYVGDIHQPLHVDAIYLDAKGRRVDPDKVGYQLANDTQGGNSIYDGSERFHHEWDAIPTALTVNGVNAAALLAQARQVAVTPGDVAGWSAQWATETLQQGRTAAFPRLTFKLKSGGNGSTQAPTWTVSGTSTAYHAKEDQAKSVQLARAGARLAQVLQAIWPDSAQGCRPPMPAPSAGYLATADLPDATQWLPAAPAPSSAAQRADDEAFQQSRTTLQTERGMQAANDDVYTPELIAQRYQAALGVALTPCNAPALMNLIAKAQKDGGALILPVKRDVSHGGRVRPFVAHPDQPSCLSPVDMAGHKHDDLDVFHLDQSGAYPSGHAMVGMFVGELLSELAPDRAAALMQWGLGFGDSRVVCGFHYPSDVMAGRLAGAVLLARLHADPMFAKDLDEARLEVKAERGR